MMLYLHTGEELVATPQGKKPDLLLLLMEKAGGRPQRDVEISGSYLGCSARKACMSEFSGTGATEAQTYAHGKGPSDLSWPQFLEAFA